MAAVKTPLVLPTQLIGSRTRSGFDLPGSVLQGAAWGSIESVLTYLSYYIVAAFVYLHRVCNWPKGPIRLCHEYFVKPKLSIPGAYIKSRPTYRGNKIDILVSYTYPYWCQEFSPSPEYKSGVEFFCHTITSKRNVSYTSLFLS